MADLLSVAEARTKLLAAFHAVETTHVPFQQALHRVLAEPLYATCDLPPFPNSSMDGYALRSADLQAATVEHPVWLTLGADAPAGTQLMVEIQPGETARIMTGAMLPPGCDAVVPVELVQIKGSLVGFHQPAQPGDYIRPQGQDVRAGELALPASRLIQPQDLGLLATFGHTIVPVHSLPRIALLSNGDELLDPHEPLQPGKIRDANTSILTGLLQQNQVEVLSLGVARDVAMDVQEKLDHAVNEGAHLILTSAGVSVGAFDYVRTVIESHGSVTFWRVNMRPGKPLLFGQYRGVPIIGLPGNPVSAYVGFQVFVRPVLQLLRGLPPTMPAGQTVRLAEAIESDGRESYLRAQIHCQDGVWQAQLSEHQGSGNILSLTRANALLIVPSGVKSLPAGTELIAWLFNPDSGCQL